MKKSTAVTKPRPEFLEWQRQGFELLKHKFRYYIEDRQIISDMEFDLLEKKWIALGKRIGKTREAPFWIGFDWDHPFAQRAAVEVRRDG